MNIRSVVSKFLAYSILGVIILGFIATFITVPFHQSETSNETEEIELEEVEYPEMYVYTDGYVDIADKDGIRNSSDLIRMHKENLNGEDTGLITYSLDGQETIIHWNDQKGALIQTNSSEDYVINEDIIVSKSNSSPSDVSKIAQDRLFETYGRFGSVTTESMIIEKEMSHIIETTDYQAVKAWEVQESTTQYIKYQSSDDNSTLIITEHGTVSKFTHDDKQVEYNAEINGSEPPLFEPAWVN